MSMDIIIQRIKAQLNDIDSLRDVCGISNVVIETPKVEERLRSGFVAVKELRAHVLPNNIRITWPLDYPDISPLHVEFTEYSNDTDGSVSRNLYIFISAFVGSSIGYAIDIVRYAIDLLDEAREKAESKKETLGISLHVLKFNHLLKGPEHKKEKEMMSCGRHYHGAIYYGTPGLVALCGADEIAHEYLQSCRSVGKRGELAFEGSVPAM
jgi:hypothetical protein